jgi:Spy/CpxP family protein refolding chaperone
MKRSLKILVASAVATALVATAASAIARGHRRHHGGGFMKAMMQAHIDQALDAAKATPAQREAIAAARDHVLETFGDARKDKRADFEQALSLFAADKIDPAAVAALRKSHEADAQKVGDAIVQALSDVHGALKKDQRAAIVEYVRAHKPKRDPGLHRAFMKRLVEGRIAEALDAIKATDKQRQVVTAAQARVIAAIEKSSDGRDAHVEQALALFGADTLDQKKVAELRAEHQQKARAIGDAIVQSVTEVHDALDAAQRKQIVDMVRTHHGRHKG